MLEPVNIVVGLIGLGFILGFGLIIYYLMGDLIAYVKQHINRRGEAVRKRYVNSQNNFYNKSGYKAVASYYDKVFKVTWDLSFTAMQSGIAYQEALTDLKHGQSIFPDSKEDRMLRQILLDNKFKTYELCYKCRSGLILTAHKTRL